MSHGIRIAIDGYSSTGKSTVARQLAQKLNYRYIDTGAMYRAITYWAIEQGFIKGEQIDEEALVESLIKVKLDFVYSDEHQMAIVYLNGVGVEDQIRGSAVASKVSLVAKISSVRRFLVAQQKDIAKAGSVVMDGRDIASVVMPDAELKIFMTAEASVRARRRYLELKGKGQSISLEAVRSNLEERDYLDSNREDSPLIQTEDAMVLDNSDLNLEEQLKIALDWAKERGA